MTKLQKQKYILKKTKKKLRQFGLTVKPVTQVIRL